jgi:hypothetical protein
MVVIGRLVRLLTDQVLENIDGVGGQILLQVDPAKGIGDFKEIGQ